ncbi:MAG: hypothetical protein HYT16_03665 [DPANN group archaeon]|nr:hypothetical protein [DPANN group archaeon]
MALPLPQDLVRLTYRDAWLAAGGARFEKTERGLENILHNLGFDEASLVETAGDARDVLALAGAYEPNSIYVQEASDVFGGGRFLFPIQVYQEQEKKPGLLKRLQTNHPWLYKGFVAAVTVGTMGLAALAGFSAKPAEAYHTNSHNYIWFENALHKTEQDINNTLSTPLPESDLWILRNDVTNLKPKLSAVLDVGDAWERLNATLRKIYENETKLETQPGQPPAELEKDPLGKYQAYINLKFELFPELNQSMKGIGMVPSGIEDFSSVFGNDTYAGSSFVKLFNWASQMYWEYREVEGTKRTAIEQFTFADDFETNTPSIDYPKNWSITKGAGGGSWGARGGTGFDSLAMFLQSDNALGWASAESKINFTLKNGPVYAEAMIASDNAGSNPRARPILALYYDWDNQIVLERGLRGDENFNGQAKTFEVVNNSGYGYMTPVDLDFKTWHKVAIKATKNYAQLIIDGNNIFNHTNPNLIPSDKPLRVKFSILGESGIPNQLLFIDSVKFSGFDKVSYPMTTVSNISVLGQPPDTLALKAYLQNLSKTVDFFDKWLGNASLRQASQQGGYWSETANRFMGRDLDELRHFVAALENPDTNIPYREPDVTPPEIISISAPDVNFSEPAEIKVVATDIGVPDDFGVDRLLLRVISPDGLEERIIAKPEEKIVFRNTTQPGTYRIEALAYDRSNNTSQLKSTSFKVLFGDTTSPTLHGINLEDNYEVGTEINGTVNATDDGPASLKGIKHTQIKIERPDGLEDIVFTDQNGSFRYIPDMVGRYEFRFTTFDKSGNQGYPVLGTHIDVWEDKAPPDITNITFKKELHAGEQQEFAGLALDDLTGVDEVYLQIHNRTSPSRPPGTLVYSEKLNMTGQPGAFKFNFPVNGSGNYTATLTAKDGRGNSKGSVYKFDVLPALPNDTILPTIEISQKPSRILPNTEFNITYYVSDNGNIIKTLRVLVDGQVKEDLQNITMGALIPARTFKHMLPEGRHEITIEAFDPSGNRAVENLIYEVYGDKPIKTTTTLPWWPLLLLAGGAGVGGAAAWRFLRKPSPPPMTAAQQRLVMQAPAAPVRPTTQPPVQMPAPQPQIPTAGIEELFYIANDGRPLSYKTSGMPKESDIISGMFTAVISFVKDSGWQGTIDEVTLGGRRIMIERGKSSYLAAVVQGQDGIFIKPILKRGIADLESVFDPTTWDGDKNKVIERTTPYLDSILKAAPTSGVKSEYVAPERIILTPPKPKSSETPPGKIQFTKEELLALKSAIPTLIDVQKRLAELEAKLATANAQERKQIEEEINKTRLLLGKTSEGELDSKDNE